MVTISGDDMRDPTPAEALLAAYYAASRGWRVFPQRIADGLKVPAIRDWPNKATTDKAQLELWWSASNNLQDCVPGIATGRESGLWALDPDTKRVDGLANLAALCESNGDTYENLRSMAMIVKTPSGGEHWYFAYPPDRGDGEIYVKNRADRTSLAPGIDVRGDKGQIAAPHIRVQYAGKWTPYTILQDQTPLQFAPLWLESLVTGPRRLQDSLNDPDVVDMSAIEERTRARIQTYIQSCVLKAMRQLRDADPGTRNTELNRKIYSLAGWHPWGLTREDTLRAAEEACSLDGNGLFADDHDGFLATFDSAWRSGIRVPLALPADVMEPITPVVPGTAPAGEVRNRDTDQANAEEFSRRYRERYAWTPEVGWLYFNGTHWTEDNTKTRVIRVNDMAVDMFTLSHTQEEAERDILRRRARRLESAPGIDAALKLAEPLMATYVNAFDTDPYLLNCENGTLDLRTGRLRDASPSDFITQLAPTRYVPDAQDDTWDRVVREAFEGDVDRTRVFQRFMGYSLSGLVKEKKILVAHGPTNTAKSTLTEPFMHVLGSTITDGYATTWDTEMIQAKSRINRAEKMNKARAARFIIIGEIEHGTKMADGFVKRFTGGDTVDARALYKASYDVRPVGKLWMVTNYIPQSADPAVHGRMLLLPMMHVPRVMDRAIKEHLDTSKSAHEAMLAWAVAGFTQWHKDGLGSMPWLAQEVDEYARESDHVLDFISQCFDFVEGDLTAGTSPSLVYRMYTAWAQDNVEFPYKMRVMEKLLLGRGYGKRRHPETGTTMWLGMVVKNREDLPESARNSVDGWNLTRLG